MILKSPSCKYQVEFFVQLWVCPGSSRLHISSCSHCIIIIIILTHFSSSLQLMSLYFWRGSIGGTCSNSQPCLSNAFLRLLVTCVVGECMVYECTNNKVLYFSVECWWQLFSSSKLRPHLSMFQLARRYMLQPTQGKNEVINYAII